MKSRLNTKTMFFTFAFIPLFAFVSVVLIPFLIGLFMTFTQTNGVDITTKFIGLSHYFEAFKDQEFWESLKLTIEYTIYSLILVNFFAFILALLVTSKFKGQNFFRIGFFVPNLIGGVILGFIWQFVFDNLFPFIGKSLSIDLLRHSWLTTPKSALWSMVMVSVWQNSGYMMLLYMLD